MISRKHNTRKTEYYFAVTETGEVLRGYYGRMSRNSWNRIFWAKPMQPGRTYIHGNVAFRLIRFANGEQTLFRCKREWPHDIIDLGVPLHPVEVFQYAMNHDGSNIRLLQLGNHRDERYGMVRCFQNCRQDYLRAFGKVHVFGTNRLRGSSSSYKRKDPIFQRIGLFNVTDPAPMPVEPESEAKTNPTQPGEQPMEVSQ